MAENRDMAGDRDLSDREIVEIYRQMDPVSGYMLGFEEDAGKFFVPSSSAIQQLLGRIESLAKKSEGDRVSRGVLESIRCKLLYSEMPYNVASEAVWAFFAHLSRPVPATGADGKSWREEKMLSLVENIEKSLVAVKERLGTGAVEDMNPVLRIISSTSFAGLANVSQTLAEKSINPRLKEALMGLARAAEGLRKRYGYEDVRKGSFAEAYSVLMREDRGDGMGRKDIYEDIWRYSFDYPSTPTEMEEQALVWLKQELPIFREYVEDLSSMYGCDPHPEALSEAITKRRRLEPGRILSFATEMREHLRPVVEERLVRITPLYDTRIVETPPYLLPFISTAAMTSFNTLVGKPFNYFFVTTDPSRSPSLDPVEFLQTLVHEEYGHCVNYSNVAVEFSGPVREVEKLHTNLTRPITEGISFHREIEFLDLLHRLVEDGTETPSEKRFLEHLERFGARERLLLEMGFVTYEWRILRFIRCIGDIRINTDRQSFLDYLEWASGMTDLPLKTIYDQLIIFMDNPGYACSYAIGGMLLAEEQMKKRDQGRDILDFNTYASAAGFPPLSVYMERLREW